MPEAMLSNEAMGALLGLAGRCSPNSTETAKPVYRVLFAIALVRCPGRLPHPHERG
jgi:hypothetical protein